MREEDDFAALYKKLIDSHFTPPQERAKAALQAVLSCLSDPGTAEASEFPENQVESPGSL